MGKGRKVRSDKKVDVKPTLPSQMKRYLYDICFLSEEHVKDVAEKLCLVAIQYRPIIDVLRPNFRRNYIFENTVMMGNADLERMDTSIKGSTGKVTIKFKKADFDRIADLAYALDVTPTTAAGLLIRNALSNKEFLGLYTTHHVPHLETVKVLSLRRYLSL